MDFLNKAKSMMGSKSGSSAQHGTTGQPGQKEDYIDKAFAFGSKKFGTNVSRQNQEKITDAGRGFYEKQTGSKVSDKVSN